MPRKKKEQLTDDLVDKKISELEKKNEVIALEKFCVNASLDNLEELTRQKEQEMISKIEDYRKLMGVEIKNDFGEVIDTIHKD